MQTLFLLPGLLCDASVWAQQMEGLRDVCEVRAFPDFYDYDSIEGMARAVLAAAPPRFHLCGHSMGGRVALEVWRLAPERVQSLILLDTGTDSAQPGECEKRGALVELARSKGMDAVAAQWLPPMVHPGRLDDKPFMDALTKMVCRVPPEAFAREQHALLTRPDAGSLLARIACPTLVGCGADDAWSPLSQHEAMAAAIPGARLVSIPDSGHMVSVEAPDALNAVLRAWMLERAAHTIPFTLRKLDHVVLRVRDLQASLRFYRDVLGCPVDKIQERVGLWQVRAGESLIDLIPLDGPLGKLGGAGPGAQGRNLDHFAIQVAPFEEGAIRAHLAAHKIEIADSGRRYGAEGDGPSIYIRDPDGNIVELKGPAAH